MSGRCNGRQDVANKLESSVAGREDWMERSGGTTRGDGRYVEVGCGTVYVPGSYPRRYVLMYRDNVRPSRRAGRGSHRGHWKQLEQAAGTGHSTGHNHWMVAGGQWDERNKGTRNQDVTKTTDCSVAARESSPVRLRCATPNARRLPSNQLQPLLDSRPRLSVLHHALLPASRRPLIRASGWLHGRSPPSVL